MDADADFFFGGAQVARVNKQKEGGDIEHNTNPLDRAQGSTTPPRPSPMAAWRC